LGKITLKLSAVTVVNTEERSFMSLTEIRNKHCKECPLHEKAHTVCVMGTGSFHKPFFVVGEAPGYQEDQMGRPFVGRSGKLLRSELIRAGVNLEKGYVTNTVKCFPDGTPTDDQTRICSHLYLRREIEEMKPQWILTVGTPAFKALTNSKFGNLGLERGLCFPRSIRPIFSTTGKNFQRFRAILKCLLL
jgi:uracil-DNA glycosylase family 4